MRTKTWLALPALALGTWGFAHAQDIEGWAEQVRAANKAPRWWWRLRRTPRSRPSRR